MSSLSTNVALHLLEREWGELHLPRSLPFTKTMCGSWVTAELEV